MGQCLHRQEPASTRSAELTCVTSSPQNQQLEEDMDDLDTRRAGIEGCLRAGGAATRTNSDAGLVAVRAACAPAVHCLLAGLPPHLLRHILVQAHWPARATCRSFREHMEGGRTGLRMRRLPYPSQDFGDWLSRLSHLHTLDFPSGADLALTALPPLAVLPHLTALSLTNSKLLNSLAGMANCQSLRTLSLLGCHTLADLSPLSSCTSIVSLCLDSCTSITSLTPLASLQSLRHLDARGCSLVTDLKALVPSAAALRTLHLAGCPHPALITLSSCTALTHLQFSHCPTLSSIQPLAACRALEWLDLSNSPAVTHINALCSCTALTNLRLRNCEALTSIQPLSSCSHLTYLDLSGCSISDLSPLAAFAHSLRRLTLTWCLLTDIAPLGLCTRLRSLSLSCCCRGELADITALSGCTALTSLDLSYCRLIVDISPLRACADLLYLRMRRCIGLTSVAALAGCVRLTWLDLHNCGRLRSISTLKACTALLTLDLYRVLVWDLKPLFLCTQLRMLVLHPPSVLHWPAGSCCCRLACMLWREAQLGRLLAVNSGLTIVTSRCH